MQRISDQNDAFDKAYENLFKLATVDPKNLNIDQMI